MTPVHSGFKIHLLPDVNLAVHCQAMYGTVCSISIAIIMLTVWPTAR